jgi:hypothetical protein
VCRSSTFGARAIWVRYMRVSLQCSPPYTTHVSSSSSGGASVCPSSTHTTTACVFPSSTHSTAVWCYVACVCPSGTLAHMHSSSIGPAAASRWHLGSPLHIHMYIYNINLFMYLSIYICPRCSPAPAPSPRARTHTP